MHPIKKYIVQEKISQKDFAHLADLWPQEINDFIAGRKNPGPVASKKIFKASNGKITYRDLRPDVAEMVLGDTPHD